MKIVLVDNDRLVLEALKMILESAGHEIVAAKDDSQLSLDSYLVEAAEIFLFDIQMPGRSGLELAAEILAQQPDAKILLLTTFEDEHYIQEAIRLGCKGYLLKQNFAAILPAVAAVSVGNLVYNEKIMQQVNRVAANFEDQRLNDREIHLTHLVAEGFNNREIAAELYLSEGTVRNLISEILAKLGLRDRTQLAVYFYKNILGQ
ncbi:MAG: response regulator transcription factor [Eubacteriales bacterium]|nr:response regulator transcription factor [Eubacteriales bacterium]